MEIQATTDDSTADFNRLMKVKTQQVVFNLSYLALWTVKRLTIQWVNKHFEKLSLQNYIYKMNDLWAQVNLGHLLLYTYNAPFAGKCSFPYGLLFTKVHRGLRHLEWKQWSLEIRVKWENNTQEHRFRNLNIHKLNIQTLSMNHLNVICQSK